MRVLQAVTLCSVLGATVFVFSHDSRHKPWTLPFHQAFHDVGGLGVRGYRWTQETLDHVYERFWTAPDTILSLEARVQTLEPLETRVRELERENQELRQFLSLPAQPKGRYVFSRILNYSPDTLTSYCLINKGSGAGLQQGCIVFSSAGLVGRIETLGSHHAKVMLLHAPDFRIPVVGEKSGVRAILGGDRRPYLKMIHRDQSKPFEEGEGLVTLHDDPWLPEGIPVGRVVHEGEEQEERIISVLSSFQARFAYVWVLSEDPASLFKNSHPVLEP